MKNEMIVGKKLRRRSRDGWFNRDQMELQSMIWPGIIFLAVFYYATFYGLTIAFKEYNIISGFANAPWVGIEHFASFLTDDNLGKVLRNTVAMNILGLFIGFPMTIIFALLLNEVKHILFKRITQTISYLPHFVSWAVFGGLVMALLGTENGAINAILIELGIIDEAIFFMGDPNYFWFIAVLSGLVKGLGWGSIIYFAAIAGVDQELYDAAIVDGSGRFGRMWYVTLPSIANTIVIMLIFNISYMLGSGFEQIFILQNPLNVSMSETIDTYVYKMGLQNLQFSYATAVGLMKGFLSVMLLLMANSISKKISDKGLF